MNGRNTAALVSGVVLLVPASAHAAGTGAPAHNVWSWWDAAIFGGVLLGLAVLACFGSVIVGAVIGAIVAGVAAAARAAKVRPRALRADHLLLDPDTRRQRTLVLERDRR
jgi:hypothetical protein